VRYQSEHPPLLYVRRGSGGLARPGLEAPGPRPRHRAAPRTPLAETAAGVAPRARAGPTPSSWATSSPPRSGRLDRGAVRPAGSQGYAYLVTAGGRGDAGVLHLRGRAQFTALPGPHGRILQTRAGIDHRRRPAVRRHGNVGCPPRAPQRGRNAAGGGGGGIPGCVVGVRVARSRGRGTSRPGSAERARRPTTVAGAPGRRA